MGLMTKFEQHLSQLCLLPTGAVGLVGEKTARTERAEAGATFPGLGRQLDAGDLSV